MKPLKQITDGIATWLVNDVVPSMPNGVNKFVAYAAIGAMQHKDPVTLVAKYKNLLEIVGIMSDDQIDEGALKSAIDTAFANQQTVSIWGFTFDASDRDKLYRRIEI